MKVIFEIDKDFPEECREIIIEMITEAKIKREGFLKYVKKWEIEDAD